jgi:hypothetical protein
MYFKLHNLGFYLTNYSNLRYNTRHHTVMIYLSVRLTVNVAAGWRGTCSSSDEVSDSESEPVAKKRLLLILLNQVTDTN